MSKLNSVPKDVAAQRKYYTQTADKYDVHIDGDEEHNFSLAWLSGLIEYTGAKSLIDVGSGTGRALVALKARHPNLRILGVEPVIALRKKALEKGLTEQEIVGGDALSLKYATDSFDLACEFGVLHHIRQDHLAVREMARVARLGVFISDSNNFGQGSPLARVIKQSLHLLKLWDLAYFIKTFGRGYSESESDGVFYSYSAFDSARILKEKFPLQHYLNTQRSAPSLYRSAPSVAIYATRTADR